MRIVGRWMQCAGLLAGIGCSVSSLRAPGSTGAPGGPGARPALQPMTPSRASGGSVVTVCRGAAVSSHAAIIDYVASSGCTSKGTYNAMLVEDLSRYPLGSSVVICANQRRPADWNFTGANLGETGQCPREPTDRSTSPTVVEIIRRRESN
jgi:hypothetical protein